MNEKTNIYLDNAATTALDPEALVAMKHTYENFPGNPSSLHKMGRASSLQLEKARSVIASKINALPDEIIFTSSGTESNNLALRGVLKRGDHFITSKIEHPSVLELAKVLKDEGIELSCLNVDHLGFISLDELEREIRPNTKLVSIHHANNEVGTVEPIEKVANLCQKKKILFHMDACQSFGKIKIDTQTLPVDLISFSAHKVHGPLGAAALFIRKGLKLTPLFRGGGQEQELRSGTVNTPAVIGFAEALKDLNEEDQAHTQNLCLNFLKNIKESFPDVVLNGPEFGPNRLSNNLNLSFKGIDGKKLFTKLSERGIAISTGSACSSAKKVASPVLLAMGRTESESLESIRISLSKWTTINDMGRLFQALKEIIPTLRDSTHG